MSKVRGSFLFNPPYEIAGWVWDPLRPKESLSIEVRVNGTKVFEGLANAYRLDLERAGIGNGHHGFFVSVRDYLRNGPNTITTTTSDGLSAGKPLTVKVASSNNFPKYEATQSSALRIVNTRHGSMLINIRDDGIDRVLEEYGEWAPLEAELFKRLLKSGDVAIDAGAHIGSSTLPMADAVGHDGKVFAFEPQRFNFFRLCANLALNGVSNVYPLCAALTAHKESNLVMPFVDYTNRAQSGSMKIYRQKTNIKEEHITTTTLDDHIDLVWDAKLIKIDVEGHELEVLLGAEDLLKLKNLKYIYFECHDKNNFREIVSFLKAKNESYEFYWHPTPVFSIQNFNGKNEDIYDGLGYSLNILATSEKIDLPADIFHIKDLMSFWPEQNFPDDIAKKIRSMRSSKKLT